MTPRMLIAEKAYKGTVPDWIKLLVQACDADGSSQNKVAARLGYSSAVVSNLIHNSYDTNREPVKAHVMAVYAPERVVCPALGIIGTEDCLGWRREAGALNSASPLNVLMFRACRSCPRNAEEDEGSKNADSNGDLRDSGVPAK